MTDALPPADLGNACTGFDAGVLDELRAVAELAAQGDGLLIRLMDRAGARADAVLARLPRGLQAAFERATSLALEQAYAAAFNLQGDPGTPRGRWLARLGGERGHRLATAVTGALGGAGGLATTLMDLPVTATLILRSIQQIAVAHGEDIAEPDVRAQCLAVLAFGPIDGARTGRNLGNVRLGLSGKAVAEVMRAVLPRFGIVVGNKLLAQATPVLGAVAGAAVNPVFTGYYQTMAHVHFRLRALERLHDAEHLRACFERIAAARARLASP